MKIFLSVFLLLPSAAVILCALLIIFGVSDKPDIPVGWTPTLEDIARAKKILHEGSKTKPDEIGIIELTVPDINLAANYLLNMYGKSAARIDLIDNMLRFNVTMTLPDNIFGRYLNISFRLGNNDGIEIPKLKKFKAGNLLIPARFAAFVIKRIVRHSSLNDYFILATHPIKYFKIDRQKITIVYFSNRETLAKARNFLTHGGDISKSAVYQQKLAETIAQHDPSWRLSLADLLKPLFQLAYERSTLETAIEENKLVILTANNYVNNSNVPPVLATKPTSEKYYSTFLYKRIDLAQHFIGSAAITASVNGQVAQAMGEEKELNDAQGGSGFSFIDLAADKAGTRFGEMATSSPENARKIQKAMSGIKDYSDFMPDPRDLPEHMNEAEFIGRYQSIDSPSFREISRLIDARIAATPIYK
jgi:hypothetical protein